MVLFFENRVLITKNYALVIEKKLKKILNLRELKIDCSNSKFQNILTFSPIITLVQSMKSLIKIELNFCK